MSKTIEVYPDPQGGWIVKRAGNSRIAGHFDTRKGAENFGADLCRDEGAELRILKEDGTEERRDFPTLP